MKENIDKIIEGLIGILDKSKQSNFEEQYIATFNCGDLNEIHLVEDIRSSAEYIELFNKLKNIKGPVLYWFKMDSDDLTSEAYKAIKSYKTSGSSRAVPFLKNNCPPNSEYLYIGKVKRYFWGRIVQHLGYANDPRTQGLQLFHWAKELDLKVDLYAIEFDKDMVDLIGVVEALTARQFNPITGYHSS